MAGGVTKSFGIPLLVLGIVLFLGGAAALVTGFVQENKNQDHQGLLSPGPDRDETQTNQGLEMVGIVAAAVGLVLGITGGVLLGVGSARQNRALVKAIETRPENGA